MTLADSVRRFSDTRRRTVALVDSLPREAAERRSPPDRWSVAEVLDHLVRVDQLLRPDVERLLAAGMEGRAAFIFRTLADFDPASAGRWGPVLRWAELPFDLAGALVPRELRQSLLANRAFPARAPKAIEPRRGRPLDELRRELHELPAVATAASDHITGDPCLYYYNPLIGLTSLGGVLEFLAAHERRHQEQLGEILEAVGPLAAA